MEVAKRFYQYRDHFEVIKSFSERLMLLRGWLLDGPLERQKQDSHVC